jgi:hypothetical protein
LAQQLISIYFMAVEAPISFSSHTERRGNRKPLSATVENFITPKVQRIIAGIPQPGDETIFDILEPEDISYIKNAVYGGAGKFTASSLLKDIFKAPAPKEHERQERQEVAA